MNILENIYKKTLQESEKNIKFWEDYLQNLTALNFQAYSDKLTVPILVPIGNKIWFKGSLKHTNEVTVALGADYFTKCSIHQAEVLRQHRIQDAKSKLESLIKEKNYLESQVFLSKDIMNESQAHDIIEECSEEEDKAWREKHREKVRHYYKNKSKIVVEKDSDEDLWTRLEELELQEEMENELLHDDNQTELDDNNTNVFDSIIIKEDGISNSAGSQTNHSQNIPQITHNFTNKTSNLNVLLQVIDRQKLLEEKLYELKHRETVQTRTESDVLSRLDEIEQLDELEDEMERLDDILDDEEVIEDSDSVKSSKSTKNVFFADKDHCETLEINFCHSNIDLPKEPYDLEKGITKPSDIYQAHATLFQNEITSILKKSKYENIPDNVFHESNIKIRTDLPEYRCGVDDSTKTIVITNVVEKSNDAERKVQNNIRPPSLFKKKRQQNKT